MLNRLHYPASGAGQDRILLLMLAPAGAKAEDFAQGGLVGQAQSTGLAVDVIAVQADLALYLEGGIAEALHGEIVEPVRGQYRQIWLLGISLGGMGALLYAAHYAAQLQGLILLAPFLGTRGTVAALAKAGGLMALPDPALATAAEQQLLAWLRRHIASGQPEPALYLGFGEQDRFSPGHRLLAELLPASQVSVLPGGHDWPCWRALLAAQLALAWKPA